jgi:hypothetical protein
VSRYSIALSWLTLKKLGAIHDSFKKIYVFHDGNNEFNNSNGLYATLQRCWFIEYEVNAFISYHGKGPWDGLIGSGMLISSILEVYSVFRSDYYVK